MFVISSEKLPIKVWAPQESVGPYASAIDQAKNLANHPLAEKWVCLMPDFHVGYGMPIGGVFLTRDGVVPNAVGVDIGCFTGETKVPLLNGTQVDLQTLYQRGEEFWVYSIDENKRIAPGRARCVKTRDDAELVEVTISGGASVLCTPDHNFMLRDGTYCRADALSFNDSLMPLYRSYQTRDGYEYVKHPSGRGSLTHVLVSEQVHGPVPDGSVVHHLDINHFNNTPENLAVLTHQAHSSLHRQRDQRFCDEEFKRKRLITLREKGFYDPALTDKKRQVAAQNITAYMQDRPEEFARAVAGNGRRGAPYLAAYRAPFEKERIKRGQLPGMHICRFCPEQFETRQQVFRHTKRAHANHKVVSVQSVTRRDSVYCLQVDKYHNFALAAGVFVHNCSVSTVETDLEVASLTIDTLKAWRKATYARVPVGNAHHAEPQRDAYVRTASALPNEAIVRQQQSAADYQVGTLGGGNHFIELQSDGTSVWLMIHSGSRNIGKRVCDYYDGEARKLMAMFKINSVDRELAFLPKETLLYSKYLEEMTWAMGFARASHRRMVEATLAAMTETLGPFHALKELHVHHNYAQMENHHGANYLVHRKGAVQARGIVAIPGSMGTASYLGVGLENPDSFQTCSHGAGRVLGRRQANARITHEEAVASMAHVVFGVRQGGYDEMPAAYKDIDAVMKDQADLVRPLQRLTPLAVVKG